MGDNVEYERSFSLFELGQMLDAEVCGDADLRISGVGALDSATTGQLSFLTDSRYLHLVPGCRASALIVSPKFRNLESNLLVSSNPYLTLAKAVQLFLSLSDDISGIHPAAFVGANVLIGKGVSVGAHAYIGDNSQIAADSKIAPGAYLGKNVKMGEGCFIHPRACILDGCIIGNHVIIHVGAVIGSDGYGYAQDEQGRHVKIPQTGIVQIDDDVEIGANATVDRATFGRTWIKRGAKIDNLVMIAHNVVVGEDNLLVAQVGISGSTRLGDHVVMGGQVGVVGHVQIGDGVKIGAKAGIHNSIKPNQIIAGGFPGVPHDQFLKTYSNVQRLPRLKEALKRLDDRVRRIEEALKENDGHNSD